MSSATSMSVLMFTVFLNLIGFGLILPIFPLYAQNLGLSPTLITFIMGAYSLGQFVTAPLWGRLSDSIGRRPIMIVSLIGFAISYILLAYAKTAESLFIIRCMSGVFAGNLAIAYAYMSDITSGAERAKGMGRLGAAFGVGLVVGPAIAGVIAEFFPEDAFFVTAWVAGALSFAAVVGTIFFLPETLTPEKREPLGDWKPKLSMPKMDSLYQRPVLIALLVMSFLALTSIGVITSTMALWMNAVLGATKSEVSYTYVAIGVISAVIQGGMIGPLTRWLGDWQLAMWGIGFQCVGLFLMALSTGYALFGVAIFLMSAGSSVSNPAITSLVSKEASDNEAGTVLGIFTSAGSLGRILGPWSAGPLYSAISIGAPFFFGAALLIPALAGGFLIKGRLSAKDKVVAKPKEV